VPQKRAEQVGLALERPHVATRGRRELLEIEEGQIRQRVELQVAPDVLDRVELGRVGGKEFRRELGVLGQIVVHAIRPVSIEPIPEENHRRVDLRPELSEKADDTLGVHVRLRVETKVEADVAAIGGDSQGPDGRHLAVGATAVAEPRCFAPRIPGTPQQRRHHQATLVEEREPGVPPRGFFWMRGQSAWTQPWIRASSRSAARR